MGLIREPKDIDFNVQSAPWTEEELKDFRELMNKLKAKNKNSKMLHSTKKKINM